MKNDLINHPNSKKITIYRTGSFISRAQGAGASEYFAQSKESIGSYWESVNSQRQGSGLTFPEQELLLPNIIDTPKEDREFRKKVSEFLSELNTEVPYSTGVTLEIGLDRNNGAPVSKDNMPIDLMDYIRYRHALGHPHVAASKEEGEGDMMIKFYIFDKDAVQSKSTIKTKQKDAAFAIYLKLKNEIDQVDQMLTLMGIDPREYANSKDKDNLKIERLRTLAEDKPKEFIEANEAGDLDIRSWIQTMINTAVIKKLGTKYMDVETNELLANSEDELIMFFKDELNSGSVLALKQRMQEGLRNPIIPTSRKTVV